MIAGQYYKQFIQEQGLLQQNIAEGWGYQIDPKEYLVKKQKIVNTLKIAKIKPMKNYCVYVSKELQKVQEEIKQMNNQKRIHQNTIKALTEGNNHDNNQSEDINNDSYAMKMMHQRIDEYNFIVQHRHIKQKNSEKARKILGIHKKQQSQIILQQIQDLKKLLKNNNTIQKNIKINLQIVQLYKLYKQQLFKSKETSERQFLSSNPNRRTQISNLSKQNTTKLEKNLTQFSKFMSKMSSKASTSNKTQQFVSMKINHSNKISPQSRSVNNQSENNLKGVSQPRKNNNNKKDEDKFGIQDLVIMQQLNESQEGQSYKQSPSAVKDGDNGKEKSNYIHPQSLIIDHELIKMKRKTSQYAVRKRMFSFLEHKKQEKYSKKQKMRTTIEEVYNQKQQFDRSKKLDKYLNQSKDVLQIWKHRINQNLQKNQQNYEIIKLKPEKSKKRLNSTVNQQREQQLIKKEQQYKIKRRSMLLKDKIELIKHNQDDQEKMFSILVKKKISKFKKIPGTSLIQPNNALNAAKEILGPRKNRNKSYQNSSSKMLNDEMRKNIDVPQWMIIEGMNKIFRQQEQQNRKLV